MKIYQSMWIQWPLKKKKNLNQRSLTPRLPLTPSLLGSHVWLCPRIIVSHSKSHENISKYVDTVTLFQNLNKRSLTPRWPLTPHLLRSHVWLYPRITVSKSHEKSSMWIQWSILQNTTYYTYIQTYIHTYIHTYYIQNEWSPSLSKHSSWTQFRRDKKLLHMD